MSRSFDAERRVDLLAVGAGDVADLEDAVDEHPQPELRGDAAGGDVRAVEKAEVFEVLHDVADGGGADLFRHGAGERARADGLAGVEVAFDHPAEDLAAAVVHLRTGSARGRSSIGFPNGPTN